MPTSYSTDWNSVTASKAALKRFQDSFAKDMGGVKLTNSKKIEVPEVIPSGSLILDDALRIGGYPTRKIIQIWGVEDAGKTTLAMIAVANAQRLFPNKVAGWIDMEQTFNKEWATVLGVDLDRLLLVENPHTAEDACDAMKRLVHSGMCSAVVLDSIGGMITRPEFEKESTDATVAAVAGKVTRLVKQINPMMNSNGTTSFIINQVRAKINSKYGGLQRTGGYALDHLSAVRIRLAPGYDKLTVKVRGEDQPVGHNIVARIEKNKTAAHGSVASFWLIAIPTEKYGPIGIDKAAEAFDFGRELGIIPGSGWYTVPGVEKPINGKDKVITHLRSDPELVERIRAEVISANAKHLVEDAEAGTDDTDTVDVSDLVQEMQQ